MIRNIACSVALLVVTGACRAASFDLTSSVQGPYDIRELGIDLGQSFSRIDGARIRFQGEYTPGVLYSESWIPPRTYPADDFFFLIRLDDPGTSWIDKSVHAKVPMAGLSGDVAFDLPLYDSKPPSIFPGGNSPPNYDFLLDGRFGLSVTGVLFSLPGDQLIAAPIFKTSQFTLEIDGVAIPEPQSLSFCVAAGMLICNLRRRSSISTK